MSERSGHDEELRRIAEALDRASRPVSADQAMARRSTHRPKRPGGRWLAVGVLATAAAAAVAVGVWPDDPAAEVKTTPPAEESTTVPTGGALDVPPILPGAFETQADFEALPDVGVAVFVDGEVSLFGLDGSRLTDPVAGDLIHLGGSPAELRWEPPGVTLTDPGADATEVPAGCAGAATAGGVRVAWCGGSDPTSATALVRYDEHGASTELAGTPGPVDTVGHWRQAMPAPDGAWVLGQWSGECEIPYAVLVPSTGGEARAVGSGTGLEGAPKSIALGWAPDGRAVVLLPEGACSSSAAQPGVYLVDPASGALTLVADTPADPTVGAVLWQRRQSYTNGLEDSFLRAVDELGLEGCCGEPSHGRPGVTAGAIFEGDSIAVAGAPNKPSLPAEDQRVVDLLDAGAIVYTADGIRQVAFFCGPNRWTLSWWQDDQPEVDSMLLLAEALVPRLGCTLLVVAAGEEGG